MNEKDFNRLVQIGRDALTGARRSLWTLADTAAEFPRGKPAPGTASASPRGLAAWAQEVGIAVATARDYRITAEAWPEHQRRPDKSFTVHLELASDPDRFERIEEVDEARDVRASKSEQPSPEQEVKIAKKVMSHPERAEEVLEDEAASRGIGDAMITMAREEQGVKKPTKRQRQRMKDITAEGEQFRHTSGFYLNKRLVGAMYDSAQAAREAADWADEMEQLRKDDLLRVIGMAREGLDLTEMALMAGTPDDDTIDEWIKTTKREKREATKRMKEAK